MTLNTLFIYKVEMWRKIESGRQKGGGVEGGKESFNKMEETTMKNVSAKCPRSVGGKK